MKTLTRKSNREHWSDCSATDKIILTGIFVMLLAVVPYVFMIVPLHIWFTIDAMEPIGEVVIKTAFTGFLMMTAGMVAQKLFEKNSK